MMFTHPAEELPTEKLASPSFVSEAVWVTAMFATVCPATKFNADVCGGWGDAPGQTPTYPAAVGPVTVTFSAIAVAGRDRSTHRYPPDGTAELWRVSTRRVGDCGLKTLSGFASAVP